MAFQGDVQATLDAQCVHCHADSAPGGGWRATSYLDAIACTASGAPVAATTASGGPAPIVRVLDRDDHAGLLSVGQRELLASWVSAGAPRTRSSLHGRGFADPRSPASHGRSLRARRYAPLLDPKDADACGNCHDGAPSRRSSVVVAADDAPACTTCHADANGVFACSTCHGSGARDSARGPGRAYPPRDRCFFPTDHDDHTHAAHAAPSASRAVGLPCSTCHPEPIPRDLGGLHTNGYVDVWFDYAVAGREARFDAASGQCSRTCHDRGGARPTPQWNDGPMTCNDCHASPPANHYRGSCTTCHREANATGTALSNPVLHANGKVDLGDGSGGCGACHGRGDDPWPSTGAHRAHAAPSSSAPVACETCHDVPANGARHPTGRGSASVRLAGLATHGGRRASYDATTKTCAATYCHESAGGTTTTPTWEAIGGLACSACHGAPPPPPHAQAPTCGGSTCHEGSAAGLSITAKGRAFHVNGIVDRGLP